MPMKQSTVTRFILFYSLLVEYFIPKITIFYRPTRETLIKIMIEKKGYISEFGEYTHTES
jgi:hypothetical protein